MSKQTLQRIDQIEKEIKDIWKRLESCPVEELNKWRENVFDDMTNMNLQKLADYRDYIEEQIEKINLEYEHIQSLIIKTKEKFEKVSSDLKNNVELKQLLMKILQQQKKLNKKLLTQQD